MDKPNYCFYAKVKRVVDADTIDLAIDCGFGIFRNERIRLAHVNAWEVRGEEREKGSLETGKIADLAILTEDPLTCPEENIKNIMAKTTIVGGKIVHQLEDAI